MNFIIFARVKNDGNRTRQNIRELNFVCRLLGALLFLKNKTINTNFKILHL